MLMIIALVLLTLVFLLVSLKNSLKSALGKETETIPETLLGQYRLFISNNINVVFIGLFFVIVVLKFTYDGLMGVGVTTNYAPAQPITFSHKVHAGMNGIDCNYCHTSARKSKHSGIPSANVCMNCHTYISEGSIAGKKQKFKRYMTPLVLIRKQELILMVMSKNQLNGLEFIICQIMHILIIHSM